jgi:hypothetical protein
VQTMPAYGQLPLCHDPASGVLVPVLRICYGSGRQWKEHHRDREGSQISLDEVSRQIPATMTRQLQWVVG